METIYDITVKKPNGEKKSLADYKGEVLLIVNTASKCGFASQFEELQTLFEEYNSQGLTILGFPSGSFKDQEYDDIDKTMEFAQITHGVTFPMFAKIDVKGENIDPLYTFLTSEKQGLLTEGVKWNFTKFLVDDKGQVVDRIAPQTSPLKMKKRIEELIH